VAVTSADLTLPPAGTGELDPAWWATGALAVLLPVWIAAGVAVVPAGATTEQSDAVVRAYAYGTAYDAKAAQMSASPNSVGLDGGDISLSYSKDQRDYFIGKARAWWATYTFALDEAGAVVVDVAPRQSYSQPISMSF